jgi:MULE transposase domain
LIETFHSVSSHSTASVSTHSTASVSTRSTVSESDIERVSPTNDTLHDDEVMKYGRESRAAINASDDQDVMIALVWVLPAGKRLFRAYPEVLFIDGTHKTNSENRPLIVWGIKDADGKIHVVIRAFVPNERNWLYRWLFQTAVPSLVGRQYCKLVQLVITDGDSQETSQLDSAITSVFTKAKRRRCGWHIVEKGWHRYVSNLGKSPEAKTLTTIVKDWIYSSLMKDVETMEEYEM